MRTFYIKRNDTVMGIANYPDEAQEFGTRISGWGDTATWAPNGHLIRSNGEPTGWRIVREKADA